MMVARDWFECLCTARGCVRGSGSDFEKPEVGTEFDLRICD